MGRRGPPTVGRGCPVLGLEGQHWGHPHALARDSWGCLVLGPSAQQEEVTCTFT